MLDRLAAVVVAVFLSGWAAAAQTPAAQFAEFLPKSPAQVKPLAGGASATRAAVLVAADTYANLPPQDRNMPTAGTTITRLREGLLQHGGFASAAVASLSGKDVTAQLVKQSILEAARKLQPSEDGLLLVGWAGHGWVHFVEKGGVKTAEQYLLSYVSQEQGNLFTDGIMLGDLVAWLSEARAEASRRGVALKPVVVVDACRVSRGPPPAKVKPVPLAAWQVFGASEGQMVQAGQGSEPFLFLGTLLEQLASFGKLGKAATLDAVFAPAQLLTEKRSKQTPQLLPPSDAALSKAGAPALVVPRRVSLQVRCVDALTGTPLGRATIRVNDDQEAVAEAGELRRLLAPSRVVLATRAEGYLGRTDEVDLESAELGAEVTLPLLPYVAVVRGRLVPAATAKLQAAGGTAREGFHQVEFTTGRDGSFELRVPALLGGEVRVVQQGRVLQKFGLPAQPSGFLRDREGKHDGVPLVELVCELNDGALRELGADAPPVATDVNLTDPDDLTDWEQAQQAIAKKRWDLARARLAGIEGDRERVGALARQVETRWAVEQLEQALVAGKVHGDWERSKPLQAWWAKQPAVDDAARIEVLLAEIARESIPLPVRRALEAGNKAYAEGLLEQALAAYEQALSGANQHYRTQLEAQRLDIKGKLYRRLDSVAFAAELDGDTAKALDVYGKALEHSERAKRNLERLLEDPKLAGSARGKELRRRLAGVNSAPGAPASERAAAPDRERAAEVVPAASQRIETGIGLAMIRIEAQEFVMGSPASEALDEPLDWDTITSDYQQQHRVTITKPYWLGETEVTQRQWREVMGMSPWQLQSNTIEGDDVAASCVSWHDAMKFCRNLTESERAAGRLPSGYRYILPTEAEWEMACRAGSTLAYSFGRDAKQLGQHAVFDDARSGKYAHRVKERRKPNAWGLYDMHGNVWEWCLDAKKAYSGDTVDPCVLSGSGRVFRGGSWQDSELACRSASRVAFDPFLADSCLGFRPALAARSDVK
jgi:formylglycine-generating enzyme required for sulfatase activity